MNLAFLLFYLIKLHLTCDGNFMVLGNPGQHNQPSDS
jgi:hypothetical protein